MDRRKLTIALLIGGVSLLSVLASLLLLKSVEMGIALYIVGLGLLMILVEPFIGLVNYVMFIYIRPQEFIAGFAGLRVMLLLGTATLGLMLLKRVMSREKIYIGTAPQDYFVLWMLIAIGASHMAYLYTAGAAEAMLGFMNVVIMYLLVTNLIDTERRFKFVWGLISVLTVWIAVYGNILYEQKKVKVADFLQLGYDVELRRLQGIGIFGDPNDLALALLTVMPFFIFLLMRRGNNILKPFLVAALVLMLYTIYETESRGGVATVGVLFFLFFVRRFGIVPGLAAGAVAVVGAIGFMTFQRGELSFEEPSIYARIEAWTIGLDLFKSHVLFGVGSDNYTLYHHRTAHNSFILCASELGFFGLLPWCLLFYITLRNLFQITKRARAEGDGNTALWSESLLFGLTAFLSGSMFLSRTYNELLYLLIALSVAFTRIYVANSGRQYKLIETRDLVYGLGLTVASLVAMQVFLIIAY